jgi:hypothetical protein
MTLEERKADAQRRRESTFFQMQQLADQRRTIDGASQQAQVTLTKIDGELELLEQLIAESK